MAAEVGSGEFWNEIIEEAWGIIDESLRAVAERYVESGYVTAQDPITFTKLKALPQEQAITVISNMIRQPFFRKAGIEYAMKVMEAQ